jgi:hypothetical protein
MNLRIIASPGDDLPWVSCVPPGSVHDKKTNRRPLAHCRPSRQGLPGRRACVELPGTPPRLGVWPTSHYSGATGKLGLQPPWLMRT